MERKFFMVNKSRAAIPAIPFERIKEAVLGKRYELSLAFLAPTEARAVTRATKKKDTASNVLSFPLSKTSGEILICPATARAQARSYGHTPEVFLARLFIHGLCHLAGYQHGATMERAEDRIVKRFDIA